MSSALKLSEDWNYWGLETVDEESEAVEDDWSGPRGELRNPYIQPPRHVRLAIRKSGPPQRDAGEIRQRFERDRMLWEMKTETMSSLSDMVLLDEYQRIVGLGPAGVPLIIEALRDEPDHWFPALRAIVGIDHAEGAETLREAADRWISWYDSDLSDD